MIDFELSVESEAWAALPDLTGLVHRALKAGESVATASGEVSILFTVDEEMRRLNSQFRGKDSATDVLSFPADAMDAPFLGDIAIGYEICCRDAEISGKSMADHITHLIIHGYLHLLGFDHMNDTEAEEMEGLERRALASLGIADPYSTA